MTRMKRFFGALVLAGLPIVAWAGDQGPAVMTPTSGGPMSMGGPAGTMSVADPKPFGGSTVTVDKRHSSRSGVVTPRLPVGHTGFTGVINFYLVNIRTGPGTSWRIVTVLRKNTPVRVLGQRAGWLYIELQDGRRAWVSGNLVSLPGSTIPLLPGGGTSGATSGTTLTSGAAAQTPGRFGTGTHPAAGSRTGTEQGGSTGTRTGTTIGASTGTVTRATTSVSTGTSTGAATRASTGTTTGTTPGTTAGTATGPAAGSSTGATAGPVTSDLAGIPARPADAIGGREFMNRTRNLTRAQREEAILSEILRGNIPDFLRQLKTVIVPFTGRDGRQHTISYQVMPDYLAIGSNNDYIRIPMNPMTAQRIADRFGCSLPTRKMVNDIYGVAEVKLAPRPLPAGPRMMSNEYYERHQELVSQQLGNRPPGELVAGNKKDVVITNLLASKPDRVAIYGWHQTNGRPIQGLSTVHENTYADYSHGIRMVGKTVVVDGQEMPIEQVLRDPDLCRGLSDEGPIAVTRQPRS